MINKTHAERTRRRELSGDGRTAIWNRRRIRAQRLHVLRTYRVALVVALLVGMMIATAGALLIPSAFARGLYVGVIMCSLLGCVAFVVLALSGTMNTGVGATAEIWTASELRRLERNGWRLINGIPFERRDADHLLIGPGGVIVVESKFSAEGWTASRVRGAVEQVSALGRTLSLSEMIKRSGAEVSALVVLWGGDRPDAPQRGSEPVVVDGVPVAYGQRAVRAWIENTRVRPPVLSDDDIADLADRVDDFLRRREARDDQTIPPLSLERALTTGMVTLAVFALTLLSGLYAFAAVGSGPLAALVLAGALALVLSIRQRKPVRLPALAALAALAVLSGLLVIAEVITLAQ